MDKIIFLDIDGVLNNTNYTIRDGVTYIYQNYEFFNLNNIDQLKKLITVTGAKIVISSSWRREITLDEFIVLFANVKVDGIIGMTSPDYKMSRGEQINEYVKKHNIKNFVVLDDDYLIRKEFDVIPEQVKKNM